MLDYTQIEFAARPIIIKAGQFILSQYGLVRPGQVKHKSLNSLVSYVDERAEQLLVEGLAAILPDAGFITEEAVTINTAKSVRWIIDPLDGTTNFLHGLPFYCVSVALEVDGKLVIGIVYEPTRNEYFHACGGHGAWLNQVPIHVTQTARLEQTLVATGFPYHDFGKLNDYLQTLEEFMKGTRGIRRLGSAALDLAYVACGRFDLFFEYGLNAWDVAGGALLVQEAGGQVSTFLGTDDYVYGDSILASNPLINKQLISLLTRRFG